MKNFSVTELLQVAQQRTGLSDFGPPDFMEGFQILIDGLNKAARVRDDRWEKLNERFLRLLINRLRFAKDLADHPEINDEVISPPVYIVSLSRTGSTKLQRLLGATNDFQVLRLWSGRNFARIPGEPDGGVAERIQEARDYEKWASEASPEIQKWHPFYAEEPDESNLVYEASFRDVINYGGTGVQEFADWVSRTDISPNFDYFLSVVKYLQWQMPEESHKPWMFKYPGDLGRCAQLERIFGKMKMIVTHRDPIKCIPSLAHTFVSVRKLYYDEAPDSADKLLATWIQPSADEMLDHMQWRDSHPEIDILDLSFQEVTNKGEGTIKKIYDFLGMELTDAALQGVRQWEQKYPRDKHGRTNYTAGALDAQIKTAFAPYYDRFSSYF